MPSKNPIVLKKHRDAWYKKNKKKQIKRQLERRKELKNILLEYKKTLQCKDCGFSFNKNPECLDFHHLDRKTKINHVAYLVRYSEKKMMEEIKKCIPLCANCHRMRHKKDYLN